MAHSRVHNLCGESLQQLSLPFLDLSLPFPDLSLPSLDLSLPFLDLSLPFSRPMIVQQNRDAMQ